MQVDPITQLHEPAVRRKHILERRPKAPFGAFPHSHTGLVGGGLNGVLGAECPFRGLKINQGFSYDGAAG